jgi:hypothetical protein
MSSNEISKDTVNQLIKAFNIEKLGRLVEERKASVYSYVVGGGNGVNRGGRKRQQSQGSHQREATVVSVNNTHKLFTADETLKLFSQRYWYVWVELLCSALLTEMCRAVCSERACFLCTCIWDFGGLWRQAVVPFITRHPFQKDKRQGEAQGGAISGGGKY